MRIYGEWWIIQVRLFCQQTILFLGKFTAAVVYQAFRNQLRLKNCKSGHWISISSLPAATFCVWRLRCNNTMYITVIKCTEYYWLHAFKETLIYDNVMIRYHNSVRVTTDCSCRWPNRHHSIMIGVPPCHRFYVRSRVHRERWCEFPVAEWNHSEELCTYSCFICEAFTITERMQLLLW